jgi:hypothetical protein
VTQHLDDDAELYALGFTDRERSDEIEAHLATCAACCARVTAAEAVGASLAAALPPMPAATSQRRTWWPQLATAAAVVFAATSVLEGNVVRVASDHAQRTDVALTALASSHFGHTTLTANPGIVAKTIYARDGAWVYVVANGAPAGAHLTLRQGAANRDLGALDTGTPSTLFVRQPGRADEFDIVVDGKVVARGKPAY